MQLSKKILVLTILFAIHGGLNLIAGIIALSNAAPLREYGEAFVNTAVMGYIAYTLFSKRDKSTYWIAIFFAGIPIVRFVMLLGFTAYSQTDLSMGLVLLAIVNVSIFSIIPLALLFNKEVRSAFLSPKIQND